jgi:hypothetical protein
MVNDALKDAVRFDHAFLGLPVDRKRTPEVVLAERIATHLTAGSNPILRQIMFRLDGIETGDLISLFGIISSELLAVL